MTVTPDSSEVSLRRRALGALIEIARAQRGWSVEAAAEKAGLGHMTLRRVEDGAPVRAKTYAALDVLFDLPSGTTNRAVHDSEHMVELARRMGVETSEAQDAERFVVGLSRPLASVPHVRLRNVTEGTETVTRPEPDGDVIEVGPGETFDVVGTTDARPGQGQSIVTTHPDGSKRFWPTGTFELVGGHIVGDVANATDTVTVTKVSSDPIGGLSAEDSRLFDLVSEAVPLLVRRKDDPAARAAVKHLLAVLTTLTEDA